MESASAASVTIRRGMLNSSSAAMLASANAHDRVAARAISSRRLSDLPVAFQRGGDRRAARRDGALIGDRGRNGDPRAHRWRALDLPRPRGGRRDTLGGVPRARAYAARARADAAGAR